MNKQEQLQKIDDLEEIIKLQKDKINELELRLLQQPYVPTYPQPAPSYPLPYVVNSDPCNDGNYHEYPNPWHGTTPPHCKKCGKQAPNYEITFGGTGDPNIYPNTFTAKTPYTISGGNEQNMGITLSDNGINGIMINDDFVLQNNAEVNVSHHYKT